MLIVCALCDFARHKDVDVRTYVRIKAIGNKCLTPCLQYVPPSYHLALRFVFYTDDTLNWM